MKRSLLVAFLALSVFAPPIARAGSSDSPSTLPEMVAVLKARRMSVDFEKTPLTKVLAFISKFTGVNLIESPALVKVKDSMDLSLTLSLDKVTAMNLLKVVLDLKNLAAVYRDGVIMITTPKDALGKPVLRIYSIADLTMPIRDFPGPDMSLHSSGSQQGLAMFGQEKSGKAHAFADADAIMDLVRQNTGTGTWDDKGVSISAQHDRLVVRQYRSVQIQIEELLDMLRAYR